MSGNEFLPEGYEVPSGSDKYLNMKADGAYRIRILAPPLFGQVGWSPPAQGQQYGKPIRKHDYEPWSPGEVVLDERNTIRHFWLVPVWEYASQRIKVLEIAQATIQKELKKLAKDKDWGTPLGYDVEIVRSSASGKVGYSVTPKPAKPLAPEIADQWQALQLAGFDLNRMYSTPQNKFGGDPFPPSGNAPVAVATDDEEFPGDGPPF